MNVHDVVEVVPREAMASMSPETCIIIYLSHTDHTFYLRGLQGRVLQTVVVVPSRALDGRLPQHQPRNREEEAPPSSAFSRRAA